MISKSPLETKKLGRTLAGFLRPGDVVTVSGPVGAGKTTLIQAVGKALGVASALRSPSFVLIGTHRFRHGRIRTLNHVDLYRIHQLSDHDRRAIAEVLFDRAAVSLVEWPQRIRHLLPPTTSRITITMAGEDRRRLVVRGRLASSLAAAWRATLPSRISVGPAGSRR
ncbi:MAG: tRNA (adenosine(37)-N6)-threonylcarbamoyltransferase complex ATPase subunit type 1 TsaE [Candidatus Kerfeldbacteria bacterium]|nr:tRNA (adenosine(37)-N6)-threonylcarbamoyltransferase complex ATPase subunit type 1 TsaE [Candidatus Kerfeldbacteria bacterium]